MDQICSLFRDRENVGKSLGTGKFTVNLRQPKFVEYRENFKRKRASK